MLYLFYVLGALKLWMLIDAAQRGAPYYWFCVIVCVPFGSLVYFFMVKAPEMGIGTGSTRYRPVSFRQQRADLRQLRYGDYYGPFSRPWRVARSPRVY